MTTITLVKARSGLSISCKALGHSGFAKSGEDIVCSAVTILMRTALQVLSQTSGIDFETDISLRGNLSFSAKVIKSDLILQERILTIGDFLENGFNSLSEEFPKNVTFEIKLED